MTTSDTAVHTQPFQAEVSELLHLMVHSVYSETDIFLRELVSNASDACDKLRYEAIESPALLGEGDALKIRIIPNKTAGTLTIADNGIGMERQELIDHLGTIARSGTKAFVSKLKEAKDGLGLIGQFGVGFYSAFMVADKIVVVSRRAGESDVWSWTSSGGSGFEIARASEEDAARVTCGTEIVLHLKDDAKKYLETYEIERIVGAYSDNILFPIELVPEEGEPRQINSASALWQRSKSELSAEDYKKAYQQIASAFDDPAMTLHYRAEGRYSYAVLLFAPSTKPFDLFEPSRKGRVKLYVRRVFITDDADLLPGYLRFIRGVVDSEDLPLNISREMLQNNPQLVQIRKAVATRVVSELEGLAEKDAENFAKIWDAFGAVLKEGIYEDFERREKLLALSRFTTTTGEKRSLKQVVADFKPNQTEIYYLVGDSIERLKSNPRLEAATARGIEVLLLSDPVDAFWTSMPTEFEGKPLKSLSQGDLNLDLIPRVDATDEAKKDEPEADEAATIAVIKAALGERVSDVKASTRLTSSASCLVADSQGPSRELERILSQQNRGMRAKPVLEINLRHPMVGAITKAQAGSKAVDDLSLLLLEQAQILDGELPEDPAAFAARLNRLVLQGLGG
ncbi:molecular chaperone HtpG [Bradyrhizobium diazoefficiens]|uniref:Chaperone protein HtpG n=1 Tax=Bradyrhizobium diazoefficiens SEMIA 5080 TaxID=754504 RepID=A0A837C4H8_9BRAD|nr:MULTISPECIES: molecular chaperone HtpG [Bradyrhizobium]APO56669.1 molecular chaperone HtpG [Bradyrhizobium diazoefficiens]KGJ64072.1 putative Chaperone protein htpG, HSP90 family [Bradyrhizobium diazoefficiens SEMIA 5080]KOY06653.1 heat shock protein 90 [Bradyrhizobium diazoefficiens]MCD9294285.1 molecular chaperone HtpG [Bradyrhizobium diazoefficiens]MCD9811980.1 molecular chaperone HtpG [Bradyrhizobium diazoefficiens]